MSSVLLHTKGSTVPFQSGPPTGMSLLVRTAPQPLHLSTNPKLLTSSMAILTMTEPMITARIYLNPTQTDTPPPTSNSPTPASTPQYPRNTLTNSREHVAFPPIMAIATPTPTATTPHPPPPRPTRAAGLTTLLNMLRMTDIILAVTHQADTLTLMTLTLHSPLWGQVGLLLTALTDITQLTTIMQVRTLLCV